MPILAHGDMKYRWKTMLKIFLNAPKTCRLSEQSFFGQFAARLKEGALINQRLFSERYVQIDDCPTNGGACCQQYLNAFSFVRIYKLPVSIYSNEDDSVHHCLRIAWILCLPLIRNFREKGIMKYNSSLLSVNILYLFLTIYAEFVLV